MANGFAFWELFERCEGRVVKGKNRIGFLALSLAATLLAQSASALPVSGSLSGWEPDSLSFDYTYDGRRLTGRIDFAVYGNYPGTAPSGGQYVYAYQITNDELSDVSIDSFSVGIAEGVGVGDIGSDTYQVTDGVEPSFSYFSPSAQAAQSAIYLFLPHFEGLVGGGRSSVILAFSSDSEPTAGFGIIEGGSIARAIEGLPAPVHAPEPATVVLLGSGTVLVSLTHRRRRV
jgi:hypothetical protein